MSCVDDSEPPVSGGLALGDDTHMLPVTAAVRQAIGKSDGDQVTIHLTERCS
ncbi:DUF1905 domain-containing protein [Rhodococcus sp. P1Y]|uniref:DUF1905 domain-containing protein n=1 Tax=Rhodococcus sp. P1Y TaxID=1302308 RepID=UPI000EAB4A93|nr:DUF1905 domain-containing protein [Rhodococcus sp. P1Y]AYJ48011.1 DUF1905 domain-containing protein [Rhodococcus sp. P1Y]